MKKRQNTARWLGLALACGTLTIAVSTQAVKPPKPPPTSPAYAAVYLGGFLPSDGLATTSAADLNDVGQVVGYTAIPGYPQYSYYQACLLNPRDTDANGLPDTWFADADSDGQNDLILGLGTAPGSHRTRATAVNDLGLVVGISSDTKQAFIVVPSEGDWYQDANGDGVNDLMVLLGTLPGKVPGDTPNGLNINNPGQVIGWFSASSSAASGFLLTPVEVSPGAGQWFQDDGNGANALMVDLGAFIPSGLNDYGQVVGKLGERATLRQPDGTLVDLGAGALPSEARVINNVGQIGLSFLIAESSYRPGLLTPLDTDNDGAPDLWYRDLDGDGLNDLIIDIGGVQGLGGSVIAVQGLNAAGSVVGDSWNNTGRYIGSKRAAFLWENGVVKTLTDLTGGVFQFRSAGAINQARQIVSDGYILLPTR